MNIHGESETTPEGMSVSGEEDRGTRSSTRRHRGQYSWLGTCVALCSVHAVLLVAYGVHSKWQWAVELTDNLADLTLVLFCCRVFEFVKFKGVW